MVKTYIGDANANTFIATNGENWVIDGRAGNDSLVGANLADTIIGGAGADTMAGGGGADTASYQTSAAGVTVNLGTGMGSGGDAAGDRLSGIENLTGSNFADVLYGDAANRNVISGGLGNDTIFAAGTGSDVLDGGAGTDTVDFSLFTVGLTIELQAGTASDMSLIDPFVHFYSGFENATGGAGNDLIVGEYGANVLDGGAGNDTLRGSTGADTLKGGAGVDTADFSMSEAAVTANLTTGTASGGEAQGDSLTGVENLQGTEFGDLLVGNASSNYLFGVLGNDTLMASGYSSDTLNGGGGIDTADYSLFSVGLTIDLASGTANDASAIKPFVHFMTSIENAVGGSGGDLMIGTSAANVLDGGAGNDTLRGGYGADLLKGGTGSDTADYSTSKVAVTANLTSGIGAGGEAQGDTLVGVENLIGTEFGDLLIGDGSANVLNGVLGNDTLRASGTGGDSLIGGGGIDTADYSLFSVALTIDLASGTASDNSLLKPFVHFMSGIENAIGGTGDNLMIGDAGANVLDGNGGNDTLRGGLGADLLRGGAGVDTGDYSTSTAAVTVSLASAPGIGGEAEGDTLTGIENLIGTEFGDCLIGDGGANSINGVLGNDKVEGGAGADTIAGGGGLDIASYQGSSAGVTVNLDLGTGIGGDAAGDSLTGIEGIYGSAQGDKLIGSATQASYLIGLDGNDTLIGGDAANEIVGGSGADSISGGNGNSSLSGESGADTISGGAGDDFIRGGDGADVISAGGAAVSNIVLAEAGADTVTGGNATDIVQGGSEDDSIQGGAGVDYLYGDEGNDTVRGGDGADERLEGGAGNDLIAGGSGWDNLYGQGGTDTFEFESGSGWDVIFDFDVATEVIRLQANIDGTGIATGADVLAFITYADGEARINFGGENIIDLVDIAPGTLTAANFSIF